MAADTHHHRNLIDDVLDLGLLVGGLFYFLFGHRVGLEFSDTEIAAIASSGAAIRILIRKILMRLWGGGITALEAASVPTASTPLAPTPEPEPEPEPEPPPSETPTAAPEAPVEESKDESPLIPPPPVVGGGS